MPLHAAARNDRVVKVKEIMTTEVVTVSPEAPMREVARLLVERRISGVPVVDGAGRLLGVVSETDIVQKEARAPRSRGGFLRWLDLDSGEIRAKLDARTAGEAMTSPALTIDASQTVNAAASLMLARGCKRLPVTHGGALVGIVSRSDLVRAFVRTDAEIEQEIREGVALATFAVPPETLTVESREGAVTLGGEVETGEMAGLLAEFVARVPGVVSVRSHLTSRDEKIA
jgi:CBS domain-containing protein